MTDSELSALKDHPMYREFVRIFGESLDQDQGFVMLPLVGEADALEFLRTVPAGTSVKELPALAAAYRDAHPVIPTSVDSANGDEAV